MFLYVIIIICWAALIALYLYKGHYIAGAWNLIIGLYELMGPFFYYFTLFEDISLAQRQYESNVMNSAIMMTYLLWLLLIFIITNIIYLIVLHVSPFNNIVKYIRQSSASTRTDSNPRLYYLLYVFVLITGIISMTTGSGEAKRSYYDVTDVLMADPISRAHGYGVIMLVAVVGLIAVSMYHRDYKLLLLQMAAALPISMEIFTSGRRSSYGPSILLILLIISYLKQVKNKKTIFAILLFAVIILTSIQFLGRADYYKESYQLYGADLFLKPAIGEFVSVGATSLNTFLVISDQDKTWGMHYIVSLLDSIPYVKLGDVFEALLGKSVWKDYRILSPHGGFSMLADSYLAFGHLGYLLISFAFGIFMALSHSFFEKNCIDKIVLNRTTLFYFGFIPLVMAQYRVGAVNGSKMIVAYIILYAFTVVLPAIFMIKNRGKIDVISVNGRNKMSSS